MFNAKNFLPLAANISPIPQHGESWTRKFANWWGGATIASPTMEVVGPAKQSIKAVRRFLDDPQRLRAYYLQDMEYSRSLIRQLLQVDDATPVIFEASGTSAILLASRIFAHLNAGAGRFFTITTDEGGSLVPATLKGRDPNEMAKTMFQPASSLFYEAEPVLPYPQDVQPESRLLSLSRFGNAELVTAIKSAAETLSDHGRLPGCIVLPHVSKTGRILPIKEVARVVEELRASGMELYYIVDDIQGIGRMDAESVANPVSFCDAYLFGSSKALGGMLIASAIVIKPELLDRFVGIAGNGSMNDVAWISHFQFEPDYEDKLPIHLFKQGAISIPEVVAMREAVRHHYLRGQGQTYSERRQWQLKIVRSLREQVLAGLATIDGIEVLESTDDRPIVPSIVCLKTPQNWSPNAFKQALQEGEPIVTPSASIGRYVRLDIPEYRSMPSVAVLVNKIRAVLAIGPAH